MGRTNNVENVTAGKPKVGGAVFRAPLSTTLPTDAVGDLDSAFKCLGYISEDGVSNSNSPETDSIKAWGGDVVLNVTTEKDDTFSMTFIEALNDEVLKMIYGDENVSGDFDTGLSVAANSSELEEYIYVIEMVLKGNIAKRVVIPRGKVTEIGEINYADDDAVGYDVTISGTPDTNGNTHYEYFKKITSTETVSEETVSEETVSEG